MSQIWLAFLTGLTTGGISCFAVQGGLLAASLSNKKMASGLRKLKPSGQKDTILFFLLAKLVAYILLGALLGALGSKLSITPKFQGFMQILAGLFMLVTVGKLLDLHPFFRYFTITPPKSIYRILRKKSLDEGSYSAGILGALTVLIPCGVTQSMMLLSVASGSAFLGAAILGMFILGTTPVFYVMGVASGEIMKRNSLKYIASLIIFFLAITSINTGQILRGSVHTLQNYYAVAIGKLDEEKADNGQVLAKLSEDGKQQVNIKVKEAGYESDVKTLKAGMPVSLKLKTEYIYTCARAFTIPEYNISKILPETGETIIEFTPTKKGMLTYTCSMGMYTGYFNVI